MEFTREFLEEKSLFSKVDLKILARREESSRGLVKQYNQELCIFKFKMFHQEASVETIKLTSYIMLICFEIELKEVSF